MKTKQISQDKIGDTSLDNSNTELFQPQIIQPPVRFHDLLSATWIPKSQAASLTEARVLRVVGPVESFNKEINTLIAAANASGIVVEVVSPHKSTFDEISLPGSHKNQQKKMRQDLAEIIEDVKELTMKSKISIDCFQKRGSVTVH